MKAKSLKNLANRVRQLHSNNQINQSVGEIPYEWPKWRKWKAVKVNRADGLCGICMGGIFAEWFETRIHRTGAVLDDNGNVINRGHRRYTDGCDAMHDYCRTAIAVDFANMSGEDMVRIRPELAMHGTSLQDYKAHYGENAKKRRLGDWLRLHFPELPSNPFGTPSWPINPAVVIDRIADLHPGLA